MTHPTRSPWLWTALAATLFVAFVSVVAFAAPAAATAPPTIEVQPRYPSNAVGALAPVVIRITGEGAEQATLDYAVEGGVLEGVLAPQPAAAAAETVAFVSRATPGVARLEVRVGEGAAATAEVHFAEGAPLVVRVDLLAGPAASARSWRFEVIDPAGNLRAELDVLTSGDALSGSAATAPLPYGVYTVRQVPGNDTALACDGEAFYASDGFEQAVGHGPGSGPAVFTITVCDEAPDELRVDRPIDDVAPPPATPTSEVRGARSAGAPLPPNTGTGTAAPAERAEGGPSPLAPVAVMLFLLPGALLAIRGGPRRGP